MPKAGGSSPRRPSLGAYGSSGRFGDPGNAGRVGPVAGYRDVPPERLGP